MKTNFFLWSRLVPAALFLATACCTKEKGSEAKQPASPGSGEPEVVLELDPRKGGVRVEPETGPLEELGALTITFPHDMVPKESVGKNSQAPVKITPSLECTFVWSTPNRGVLRFGDWIKPPVSHRLTLVEGLTDLNGDPVIAEGWGAEFSSDDFGLIGVSFLQPGKDPYEPSHGSLLAGVPHVELVFSNDVRPVEIARQVSFMDRESRKKTPVRVALDHKQPDVPQGIIIVEPVEPLPPNREFWLVVERLTNAKADRLLPHLRIYPAGRTAAMEPIWSRGYNQPRRGKFVRVGFSKDIDPSTSASSFRSEPPVPITRIETLDKEVLLFGDFATGKDYDIVVAPGVKAVDESSTTAESKWPAAIPERRASVILETKHVGRPASPGFEMEFNTCRTGDLKWKLARVSGEQYAALQDRVREFGDIERNEEGEFILDPRDGTVRFHSTELLIPAAGLPVMAEGNVPASPGEEEQQRKIEWPKGSAKPGLYLLEISGPGADGRLCGNRCLVSLTDLWTRQIRVNEDQFLQVSSMTDSSPLAGLPVRLFDHKGNLESTATTDTSGTVPIPDGMSFAMVGAGEAAVLHRDDSQYFEDHSDDASEGAPAVLITNGDVFMPGDEVKFFAAIRDRAPDGTLVIPASRKAKARISTELPGFQSPEIELEVNASGSATGKWEIPGTVLSGTYSVELFLDGQDHKASDSQEIVVSDFRTPDFHIDVAVPPVVGDKATIRVASTHFHGAPHAGAKVKWTAEWVMQDWTDSMESELPWAYHSFDDSYSPDASKQGMDGVLTSLLGKAGEAHIRGGGSLAVPVSAAERGTGVLDDQGRLEISSGCPLPSSARGYRAQVYWIIEVQAEGGESQRKAAEQRIQFAREILAMKLEVTMGGVRVDTRGTTVNDEEGEGFPVDLELFRRELNISKELVGEHLVRYSNSPAFTSVWKSRMERPGEMEVRLARPGDYVMVGTPVGMPGAVPVSAVSEGYADEGESPVVDETSAGIAPDKRLYKVGDTAILQIRSPFSGWANATIETDRILHALPPVQLRGDGDRISVPILPAYFPNAFVRIHLTNGGGANGRPSEREASCELKVDDPARILEAKISFSKSGSYLPGEAVKGQVHIFANGKPVPSAAVMVMAVDEAVLSLGDWNPPDPRQEFYPPRYHKVAAGSGIGAPWGDMGSPDLIHAQKGFILGDVGYAGLPSHVRENINPRPLWETSLRTGADGAAAFSFTAPDTLTSYRVVAFAHTTGGAVGLGEKQLAVSKPLRLKPFLPKFVREGDSVQLRCTVEYEGEASVNLLCSASASGAASVNENEIIKLPLQKGQSRSITWTTVIPPGSTGKEAILLFKASDGSGLCDSTRVSLPILPANILRTDLRSGDLKGGEKWKFGDSLGDYSFATDFPCDVMFSGTYWLPKIACMPDGSGSGGALVDVASSSLCSVLREEIAGYLPRPNAKETISAVPREFQSSMDKFTTSLIQEGDFGWLPRWPGSSEPDDLTTALVAFSIDLAKESFGLVEGEDDPSSPVPKRLTIALDGWRESVLDRADGIEGSAGFARCMALVMEARDPGMVRDSRVRALVRSLFDHRDKIDFESKCLLALANHYLMSREEEGPLRSLTPDQTQRLIEEVEREDAPTDYRPEVLGTRVRAEAMRLHTLAEIGHTTSGTTRSELQRLMKPLRDSSHDLSAQENLWILLAVKSAIELDPPAAVAEHAEALGADASPNGISLGWLGHPVAALRKRFEQPVSLPVDATWMVRATHRSPAATAEGDQTLRLTRTVHNLTSEQRDGSEGKPFELGDYVLLTYVVEGNQALHQLQIHEALPAAMELINPDLPSVRKTFTIPTQDGANQAELSYADRRGNAVYLYFDQLPPGTNRYSVLTRVAGAGSFTWPAAQAAPIYDKRFRATTADARVHAKAEP